MGDTRGISCRGTHRPSPQPSPEGRGSQTELPVGTVHNPHAETALSPRGRGSQIELPVSSVHNSHAETALSLRGERHPELPVSMVHNPNAEQRPLPPGEGWGEGPDCGTGTRFEMIFTSWHPTDMPEARETRKHKKARSVRGGPGPEGSGPQLLLSVNFSKYRWAWSSACSCSQTLTDSTIGGGPHRYMSKGASRSAAASKCSVT
ncbi:hypothetical protein PSEWESI4_04154 [Pseudomonas carbonaria]|uniref:Uncharacterized protein n=1 Tax=Zestomonas carbonaria TaxID=2762745 RepID=A0A7U7IAX2_9GAMM|nr:hypothetical protein PSEWESI4_04154 [Pseudomonas carbonaria]